MKNAITLILIIATLVFSCKRPEVQIPTIHKRIIINNSSHSIRIKNLAFYEINIPTNENFEKRTVTEGQSPPNNYGYLIPENDSLEVIYDDTLTVFHGSKIYTMLRDLRRNDMYNYTEKEEDGIYHYTYTYTFTNADFEEAKTK